MLGNLMWWIQWSMLLIHKYNSTKMKWITKLSGESSLLFLDRRKWSRTITVTKNDTQLLDYCLILEKEKERISHKVVLTRD